MKIQGENKGTTNQQQTNKGTYKFDIKKATNQLLPKDRSWLVANKRKEQERDKRAKAKREREREKHKQQTNKGTYKFWHKKSH